MGIFTPISLTPLSHARSSRIDEIKKRLRRTCPLDSFPRWDDLKRLKEKADNLALPGKTREYHGKWGSAMMAVSSKKLKPGDPEMMGKLSKWAQDQKVEFIAPVKDLARKLIEVDGDHQMAHQVLGHLQLDGTWLTPEEAFGSIDLKDPKIRVEMHQKLAEARNGMERAYPSNQVRGAEQAGTHT